MSAPAPIEKPALASSAEEELIGDTAPVESVEPWQSLTPPSVYTASERRPLAQRINRRRLAAAGAAVLLVALVTWRVAAFKGSDNAQVVASSGALADSAARLQTAPAQAAPDTQPAAAAETTAVAAVDSTTTAAAKLTIAALKPIRVGDSASLRARLGNDPKAKLGTIAWTSSAPLVARVNSRTGRVVALKEGSATITGTVNGVTGSVAVKVIPGGNVVLAGKVAVAKIITSDVPATLHAGDTVRVTAAPLGAKDENLLDRKVTWQSTRSDVASVDAYGLVTAHAPGTTEIVATSEEKSSRVSVTVATREVKFSDATSALRVGGDRFINAIRDHDGRELAAAFFVDSPDDQKNLDWLLAKLRATDANFRVTRTQPGRPNVQNADATADVVFTFSWTASGRSYDKKAKFRVTTRKAGDSWAIATLRSLDKLE